MSKYGEFEKYIKNTYSDYCGRLITLSNEMLTYFNNIVAEIKGILNCDTEIVNGDLDGIEGDRCVNGINVNKGEFIIIDNYMIVDAFEFGLVDSLKECICHEIAHNKYWNHTKWHKQLTKQYFETVKG